jgi:hypothetical protein
MDTEKVAGWPKARATEAGCWRKEGGNTVSTRTAELDVALTGPVITTS